MASGECAVTVANTYYLGRLIGSDDPANNAITDALTVIFPNQQDRGAHVNISGAGITRYAPNKDNAVRFLEYLTSDFAQRLFAEGNNEYPIVGPASGPVATLGEFSEDPINAVYWGSAKRKPCVFMIAPAGSKRFDQQGNESWIIELHRYNR